LVGQVANALELQRYADPAKVTDGYVVLSTTKTETDVVGGFAANAMTAAFGAGWEKLVLKYDGWGSYGESSFKNNEIKLMNQVENLTDALSDTLSAQPGLVGETFSGYMTELGFSDEDKADPQKAADAAVLYVADGTAKLSDAQKQQFADVVQNSGGDFYDMLNGLVPVFNGSTVQAAAATYAMMIGYVQYEDKLAGNNNLMNAMGTVDGSGVTSGTPDELINALMTSLAPLENLMPEENNAEKYWSEVAAKDAVAYIDVMGAVTAAKSQVQGNLGTSGCFSSAEIQKIFTSFADGAVMVMIHSNGVTEIVGMN